MIVYVVIFQGEVRGGEAGDVHTSIEEIFDSKEKAEKCCAELGGREFDSDDEDFYHFSERWYSIQEHEVK